MSVSYMYISLNESSESERSLHHMCCNHIWLFRELYARFLMQFLDVWYQSMGMCLINELLDTCMDLLIQMRLNDYVTLLQVETFFCLYRSIKKYVYIYIIIVISRVYSCCYTTIFSIRKAWVAEKLATPCLQKCAVYS